MLKFQLSLFNFILTIFILDAFLNKAFSKCDLKKYESYLLGYENRTYLEMRENDKIIYRGISTLRKDALEIAFKDIKDKKCPDLPTKIK